jgi:RNA polymerase sigma factor (sigma-70 family)
MRGMTTYDGSARQEATDAQVIAASRVDPGAFAAIFDRHIDAVGAYLNRRVGLPGAEDLAAETFTRAFAGRARYDLQRSDALPWLLGIASNLLKHHWRSERRRLAAYSQPGLAGQGLPSEEADWVESLEVRKALTAGLLKMARRDRDALLLHVWGDLSYADVASALGVPLGTVKSRIARARRILRELLAQGGQYKSG